jgi:hypothetical protein
MNFSVPSDKRQRILYIWKIIDSPSINIEELYNFLTFELFLVPSKQGGNPTSKPIGGESLDEVKKMIQEALDLKFLVEDPKTEEVSLSVSLKVEFEKWQDKGEEKIKKIRHILSNSWRSPIIIDEKMKFKILEDDLIDPASKKKANLFRSKVLSMEKIDFANEISGKIEDKDENGKIVSYEFSIYPKNRKIIHSCPEYNKLRKKQKKLCPHLGRVFIKLNIEHKKEILNLLEDIVEKREKWEFS